ncbi:MAG: hypothetical protein DMG36_19430 [Acidobacteria bacterium]|nr:MAG: hypothetical protein DMG36_19430 [Acidobacteriota bacterium]
MNMNLFRYVFCHFMKRMALLAILTTFDPQIIVDSGGTIDVLWTEDNSAQPRDDVFFSRSIDAGLSFSTPINVSQNPGASAIQQAWMNVDSSGNIYVTWRLIGGNLFPPQGNVYFSRSTDGGSTFSP